LRAEKKKGKRKKRERHLNGNWGPPYASRKGGSSSRKKGGKGARQLKRLLTITYISLRGKRGAVSYQINPSEKGGNEGGPAGKNLLLLVADEGGKEEGAAHSLLV